MTDEEREACWDELDRKLKALDEKIVNSRERWEAISRGWDAIGEWADEEREARWEDIFRQWEATVEKADKARERIENTRFATTADMYAAFAVGAVITVLGIILGLMFVKPGAF